MGGHSRGEMTRELMGGRAAICMRGEISLENKGGFVQIALDLAPYGKVVDPVERVGIELDVIGNGDEYNVHLRTNTLARPRQSYRHVFKTFEKWRTVQLPFNQFVAHRTQLAFDSHRLRRIGVVAMGRAFTAELGIGGVRFMTR